MSGKAEAPKTRRRVVADADPGSVKPRRKPGGKTAERERTNEAARRFKALGEPTRLRIIQFLRGCEEIPLTPDDGAVATPPAFRGARITEICRQVTGADKLSSTFSHHIKELRRVGLIRVERDGKNRWCQLEAGAFESLVPFLARPAVFPQATRNGSGEVAAEPTVNLA